MKTPKAPRHPQKESAASRATALLLTLGIHLCGFTATATAAPSDLDPEFGTGGRATFAGTTTKSVVPLPNREILVAGLAGTNGIIVRLKKDGAPVTSFGNGGKVTLSGGSSTFESFHIVAMPNGQILAAGEAGSYISVVRLHSNGSLDTTFGGNGTVGINTLSSNMRWVNGMDLDAEGRILIFGGASFNSVAVFRLTSDGYLDTAFSGDGMAKFPLVAQWVNPSAMAVQTDGKILIAGNSSAEGDINSDLMVWRILRDGNLDSSFASAGKLVLDLHGGPDTGNAICIRPNGKIVIAGYTRTQPGSNEGQDKSLFLGLEKNGALDSSFGIGGIVEVDVSAGLMDRANAATLMPDGRLIAGCTYTTNNLQSFAALRLMPNGSIDSTFANGSIGYVPGTEIQDGTGWVHDLARDPSGGIYLIGSGADATAGQLGTLVRLMGDQDSDGDGVVDASETNTGVYVSPFNTGTNANLSDTDGDELTDGEEAYQHLTKPLVPDSDGDGFLDGYEVQTGKSPIDPLDKPALVAEARTAIEFSFPSALGKTYLIEDSPDMQSWGTVESGIVGNGGTITRFYSTRNRGNRFFRVEEITSP